MNHRLGSTAGVAQNLTISTVASLRFSVYTVLDCPFGTTVLVLLAVLFDLRREVYPLAINFWTAPGSSVNIVRDGIISNGEKDGCFRVCLSYRRLILVGMER